MAAALWQSKIKASNQSPRSKSGSSPDGSKHDTGHRIVQGKRFSNPDFWRELFVAARFGLVGISATTVHITVVWLLLRQTGIAPIIANTLAFMTAFGFSFLGNYLWTFRSPGSFRGAMFRFFLIAACGFLANTLVLAFFMHRGWFSPVVSAILSTSVVPIISFFVSRNWAFKER